MWMRVASLLAVLAVIFSAGCDRNIPEENQGVVSGQVGYLQRIALPEDAVLIVQLEDVSEADAPVEVLAEQKIELQGQQVPVEFELVYDRRQVDKKHRYAVAARIEDSSGLRFITTELYGVSLAEPEVDIEVMVDPAASTAGVEDGGPTFRCSGNEPFWSFSLASDGMDYKRLGDSIAESHFTGGYTTLFGPDGGAFYEWVGQGPGGSKIKVRILPGQCEDSMAGPEESGLFDYSVGFSIGKESLAGCCRMAEQALMEPAVDYVCDDETEFTAIYEEAGNSSQMRLLMSDDSELLLTREISASGEKFSDGNNLFWSREDEAFLELDGAEAVRCEISAS